MKYIRVGIVLMVLLLLPAISWYYLDSGHTYYSETMAELDSLGSIRTLAVQNMEGETMELGQMGPKLTLSAFLAASIPEQKELVQQISKQFSKNPYFTLLIYAPQASMEGLIKGFEETSKRYGNIRFLNIPEDAESFLTAYRIKEPCFSYPSSECNYLTLADTNYMIRQVYDVGQEERLTRMIEHIALLLPREAQKKPVLSREKEK